jgi:hypothetical protein
MTAELSAEQREQLALAQGRAQELRVDEDPRKTAARKEAQKAADRTRKYHFLWGWEYLDGQPTTYCFDLKPPTTVGYETIRPAKLEG